MRECTYGSLRTGPKLPFTSGRAEPAEDAGSAATLSALPVLIVFVVAQRQFVEGLAHAGVKG